LALDGNTIAVSLDTNGIESAWDTIFINYNLTYLVSGFVDRQGTTVDSDVLVKIYNGIETQTVYTNSSGFYSFIVSYTDTYTIAYSKLSYKAQQVIKYIFSNVNIDTIFLIAGDFVNDGSINVKDAAFIKKYYGQLMPQYDIDGDGIIGSAEKEFLINNYSK
ncbi:MAG TPA: hypothetical protein PKY81_01810, partial [bacterium]|nr:hypothetical protein [bacterium]